MLLQIKIKTAFREIGGFFCFLLFYGASADYYRLSLYYYTASLGHFFSSDNLYEVSAYYYTFLNGHYSVFYGYFLLSAGYLEASEWLC